MLFSSKTYSLRKSRSILKWIYGWYKKHVSALKPQQVGVLEEDMKALDQSLLKGERGSSSEIAHRLEDFGKVHCKKTFFEYVSEIFWALLFALIIATVVRQMWFELYEIPTGSMRPTFREQDHLTVTKTAFGINFPLETRHLSFRPFFSSALQCLDIFRCRFAIA